MNTCDECIHFDFHENYRTGRLTCTCELGKDKNVGFCEKPCDDFEEGEDE